MIALTAGGDSRTILDVGLPDLRAADAVALTYHPFHQSSKSTYKDFAVANRLAATAGLRHLVLDVAPLKPSGLMWELYQSTFEGWARYANLANALYVGAPANAATLFGVGGAIITGFYADRSEPELTPQLLAAKYAQSAFANDPKLHDELQRWCDFTQFTEDVLRGYSFYDFFHWEHRMSKWGASGYSEYDLATIPGPVLSSRRLLMAALDMPYDDRRGGALYERIRATVR